MNGYLEPCCEHCGIIRLGPLAIELFDPFEWSAFVQYDANTLPTIKALTQSVNREHFEGVGRVLWRHGFTAFQFYRVKRKQLRRHEYVILGAMGAVKPRQTGEGEL